MDPDFPGSAGDLQADRGPYGEGQGLGLILLGPRVSRPGRVMFEIDGVTEEVAREALRLGAAKLSVKTRFVQRIAE